MAIHYAEDHFKKLKVEKKGQPQVRSVTGYGAKIPTEYIVRINPWIWRRVYATCYSNAASFWFTFSKEKYHLSQLG